MNKIRKIELIFATQLAMRLRVIEMTIEISVNRRYNNDNAVESCRRPCLKYTDRRGRIKSIVKRYAS